MVATVQCFLKGIGFPTIPKNFEAELTALEKGFVSSALPKVNHSTNAKYVLDCIYMDTDIKRMELDAEVEKGAFSPSEMAKANSFLGRVEEFLNEVNPLSAAFLHGEPSLPAELCRRLKKKQYETVSNLHFDALLALERSAKPRELKRSLRSIENLYS